MGACKQFRLKSQPLANQKKLLQQSFSPYSGVPYTPKVSILRWVFSKEAVVKDPTYQPIH